MITINLNSCLLIIVKVNRAAIKLDVTMIHYGFIYTMNIYNVLDATNIAKRKLNLSYFSPNAVYLICMHEILAV